MSKSVVISDSDLEFGLLEELFKQLKAGKKTSGKKGLTWDHIRALNEHRNPFERKEIEKVLPYADERVASNYGYSPDHRDLTADEQVVSLRKIFPELTIGDEDVNRIVDVFGKPVLEGAESKKLMYDYREVAKLAGVSLKGKAEIEVYCIAVQVVIDRLKQLHGKKFHNYREGALTPSHMKVVEKTSSAHTALRETQGGIWVVDTQFGKLWAGASVRHAQVRFAGNEFGWGPYGVTSQLLTHPNRITSREQLYIDCAGVEYTPNASGDFSACLNFNWNNNNERLELNYNRTDNYNEQWGSASGFLPLCL